MMGRALPVAALLAAGVLICACDSPTRATTITKNGDQQLQQEQPLPPPPPTGGATSIEGQYRLTMTASRSCSLPTEVLVRSYTATITESTPGYVKVSLSGADFWLQEWNQAGFEGTRNGDKIRFVFDTTYGPGYYFIERIDGTRNLIYEGEAQVTIGDRDISGTFDGEMRYVVPGQRPWLGDCKAADHRIVLTR